MVEIDVKTGVRFSLRSLAAFVAVAAFCCAALVRASPGAARSASLLTILLLIVSVIAALDGHSSSRVFWRGFAVGGWAYFLITLAPQHQVWTRPISEALSELADKMPGAITPADLQLRKGDDLLTARVQRQRFTASFVQVGHACFLLGFGFLGGFIAQLIRIRAERTAEQPIP